MPQRLSRAATCPTNGARTSASETEIFTVSQLAAWLKVNPQTIRRAIAASELRAAQTGAKGRYRISGADAETWYRKRGGGSLFGAVAPASTPEKTERPSTPETKAAAILAALDSGDMKRRNAAIIRLGSSDAQTVEIVMAAAAQAVEEWDGPEDDLSQWRNADLKPHFPEEAPDYLDGLYRADDAEAQTEGKAA